MVKLENNVPENNYPENHISDKKENVKPTIKMYKCNSCSYSNKNSGTLYHHKQTHSPDQIPCDVCSKVFISRARMQMHKSNVHNPVACQICSKMIQRSNLQAHKKKHEGFLYRCKLCPKSYMDTGSLVHHNKKHYPDDIKCNECPRIFNDKQNMMSHFSLVHTKTRNFSCEYCQKSFYNNTKLKSHISQLHSTERSISCDQCHKLFSSQWLRQRHSKNMHSSKKLSFACNQCDKVYSKVACIKDHMIRVHTEELNFECKYCGKKFKVDRVLKKHMRDIHEQAFSPIPCIMCGKISSSQIAQKEHAKGHIESIGSIESALVSCEMCFKLLKPSSLASHTKSHDSVTCDVCNKQLKGRHSLNSHRRIHSAQAKEHLCGICKKTFSTYTQLQDHQLIHTTEKPYKCSYPNCSNSYNNSGSRSRHISNYHNLTK